MAATEETQISIRLATPSDSQAILNCLRSAFEPYRTAYTPGAFEDTVLTPESLGQRLASMSIFVATTAEGEIIGTIACYAASRPEGHIRGMAVVPDWQGRGVAERLLSQVESELLRQNCSRVTLDTTVPLKRAVSFYEKHGFRPSGTVTDFFGMPLFEYLKEI